MNDQQYLEAQTKQCRDFWFKDHVANVLMDVTPVLCPATMIIQWSKPNDWTFGCRFIIHRRWLTVLGDIGEAVYEWGQDLTPQFLAGMDFGFFASKCTSSPVGQQFTMFNAEVGFTYLSKWLAEQDAENPPGEKDDWRQYLRPLTKISHDEEVKAACESVYQDSGEPEMCSMIQDWFIVPHVRCIGHFVGLQMALAQLKAANQPT